MKENQQIRILFVCLGNICRSPTAEGIMLHLVKERQLEQLITVDSAGTSGYHIGEPANFYSQKTANTKGIQLPSRSRKFTKEDFDRFDYILAIDKSNLKDIRDLQTTEQQNVYLFRSFDREAPQNADVPDPYYGGEEGFENVFAICYRACEGLLQHIVQTS